MSAADHFRSVYSDGAEDYQRLVEYEDAEGLLWRTLDVLVDWSELDVVEIGAGTGRLTLPLAQRCRRVRAFDGYDAMLAVARRRLADAGQTNVEFAVAEHRRLPVDDGSAGALIEGWAVAHYVDWSPEDWPTALDEAVAEMHRVVRPGGTIVLVETLGTGTTTPTPPTEALAALYRRLETVHDMVRVSVRTDYEFPDEATADEVVRSFFGDEMAHALQGGRYLPECTGIWTTLGRGGPVS